MTLTLSRSTSSCALVLAPAGLPPVSAEMNSILRPASVLFFCFRNVAMPCSIWIPPCASGPVLTVSRPILNGAACAMAGVGNLNVASAAPAAVPAINLRRGDLRDIVFLPLSPRAGVHILSGLVRAFLISQHGRIQHENHKAAFPAVAASATDRTKPIIGQCIPPCKARLRRCAAARRFGPIAAGASRGRLCDGNEHPIWSSILFRHSGARALDLELGIHNPSAAEYGFRDASGACHRAALREDPLARVPE